MHGEPLLIVEFVNAVAGPAVAALLGAFGFKVDPHHAIPDYMVMVLIVVALLTTM